MGFHTMERIVEVTNEVHLDFKNILVIGNRFPEDMKYLLTEKVNSIKDVRVKFLGLLPNDEEISKMNLLAKNLLDISPENKFYKSTKEFFAKII
jgi:CO dehydrogenase nickel-insertion accessory protein CooC1